MPEVTSKTSDQCSTPIKLNITLYLDIFQGEPAISEFDWHITPNHSSSKTLAAVTGAGLPLPFGRAHPGHG